MNSSAYRPPPREPLAPRDPGASFSPQTSTTDIRSHVRTGVSVFGILIVAAGLVCVLLLMDTLYRILGHPEQIQSVLEGWTRILGGDEWTLKTEGARLPLAKFLAIATLGAGTLVLGRLSLAVLTTGVRLILWTSSDRERFREQVKQNLNRPEERDRETEAAAAGRTRLKP